jgi:type IV pilus assembly protein PilW
MMNSIHTGNKGMTLIELMVAMAIASVLMAGIYTFYQNQLKSHITQEELVDMQQDARVGMYMMTREIRMAGFDPANTGATIRTANAGQIAFDSDENDDGVIDVATERFYFALSNDADGDGIADGTPCNLERGSWDNGLNPVALSPVALNIDALNFVYLDGAGTVLDDDGKGNVTANMAAIRSVQITLVARSGENIRGLMYRENDIRSYTNQQGTVLLDAPDDDFHRIRLTASVKVRNLGL